MPHHRVEHVDEPCYVVLIIGKGLRHRLANISKRCEMNHCLRLVPIKCPLKVGGLKYVSLNEWAPLDRVTMAPRKVIKRDRMQSVGRQSLARVRANESGTASHQDRLHFLPSRSLGVPVN